MANASPLPSGAYRTRASKKIDGKLVSRSFSVHPRECGGSEKKAKLKSELLARQWQLSTEDIKAGRLTVEQALERYINDRGTLSPSTLAGYRRTAKGLSDIYHVYIEDVDTPLLQKLVTKWREPERVGEDPKKKITKKTAKNRLSLLRSALKYSHIEKTFDIAYGHNDSKKVVAPDMYELQKMISTAKNELKPIIYLAAFGSLRRSELCGLKYKDISRDMRTVSVNGAIVESDREDMDWEYKEYPKNDDSIRTVPLPRFIMEAIPCPVDENDPEEFVFKITPTAMTSRVERLSAKLHMHYTLHSLRHYAASFRGDLNIPRKYIEEVGGWREDSVILTRHYDNTLESGRRKFTKLANDFIEENFDKDFTVDA